jgi:GNAT superfamily N-acetyltransferase
LSSLTHVVNSTSTHAHSHAHPRHSTHTEAARGKGLGKFMMLFVEMLAKRSPGPLAGVMLTIQRANTRALEFYTTRCKYAQDDISPAKARAPFCGGAT